MSRVASRSSDDRGFALIVVVLLLLAATVVAHGLLELARVEYAVAVAGRDVVQARLSARSGAIEVAETPLGESTRASPVGSVADSTARRIGRGSNESWLRRLSSEVWLAEGVGHSGRASHASSRAMWALDPRTRVEAFPAVVVTGAAGVGGASERIIAATTFVDEAPRPSSGCGPFDADSMRVAPAHVPRLPFLVDSLGSFAPLGRLTGHGEEARATHSVAGRVTPMPLEGFGACVDSPTNWGDPEGAGRWCRDRWTVVHAPDLLEVDGGVGQGILLLDGGGVLRDVGFSGVIISDGPVDVVGASRLRGLFVARGGVTVGPDAEIRGSACWAWAALRHPRLALLQRLPGASWMWSPGRR